jgi:hypothetical protein
MQTSSRLSQVSMSRRAFMPIITDSQRTVAESLEKKWFGSRDSSSVIARRRNVGIGKAANTNNAYANPGETATTIHDALRRVRGSI